MTVAQRNNLLRERIVNILRREKKPLRTPEIEAHLTIEGEREADTFDVRDAISALATEGKVVFVHPGYLVQLVEKK